MHNSNMSCLFFCVQKARIDYFLMVLRWHAKIVTVWKTSNLYSREWYGKHSRYHLGSPAANMA
jgi:hypothetical protein